MRRTPEAEVETVGNDSFLDVVSNIVGILILLVMIVGSRVKNFTPDVSPAQTKASAADASKEKADQAAQHALMAELRQVEHDSALLEARTVAITRERHELGTLAATVEAELETYRGKLDEQAKRRFDLGRDLVSTRARLKQ
ncbi:MAG: hypothetical protein WD176_05490, partial [Pirellulales bacterium]